MLTRVNFIGCGRLGKTIGKLLRINNAAVVSGIANASIESSREAVEFIGSGVACRSIRELPPADIYVIATRDDIIPMVCNELVAANIFESGNIVFHCSGSLSSDVIRTVKPFNCLTASIHPVKSFASPEESVKNFSGTYCAIEGDEPALFTIATLFRKIGGNVVQINKEKKNIYHAAGVIANNYLVTLHYHAVQSYIESGVDKEIARNMVSMLMLDALHSLENLPHEEVLTGPIQRGDTQTINQHLKSLKNHSIVKEIYLFLGQRTLALTRHSENKKAELEKIFNDNA